MTGIPGVALSGAKPRLLTIALLVVLGSCWGLYYPIFKFAVRSGLPYSGIMMAITGGVAIALLAVAFARGRPPVFRRQPGASISSARCWAISCPMPSPSSPPAASMPRC
jgi:hypothetical protein